MIWWVVILYIAGLTLLFAEFFVPGGVLGVIGGVAVVASMALGVYHFPDYGMQIFLAQLIVAIVLIVAGVMILPRTRVAGYMILNTPMTPEGEQWVSDKSDDTLLNQEGEVYTMLRPAGIIMVGDRRVNAVSDGSFIEAGARVRVIEVHGNRVVVERLDEPHVDNV